MSRISKPIKRWNEVIGQEKVMANLHALLRNPAFMTRGLIFEGPYGVGKTSTTRLAARALMCLDKQPLGCLQCASCITADQNIEAHPDFMEIDAASHSGVDAARTLMLSLSGPPSLGRRHVVVIDEAHRLSLEAWEVFLKPLETDDDQVEFFFVTTEPTKIPVTIASRCCSLRFTLVRRDDLIGLLMSIADTQKIPYTYEGLVAVANEAFGRPRDAIKGIEMVAATGDVTKSSVEAALNYDSTILGGRVYYHLLLNDLIAAVAKADELAQLVGPAKAIETLFSLYAMDTTATRRVVQMFPPLRVMTEFFLKWSTVGSIPADVIPLFVMELNDLKLGAKTTTTTTAVSQSPKEKAATQSPSRINPDSFKKRMESKL